MAVMAFLVVGGAMEKVEILLAITQSQSEVVLQLMGEGSRCS